MSGSQEDLADFLDNIRILASITSELDNGANRAQILTQARSTSLSCRIAAIGLVIQGSAEITRIAHELENATVEYITSQLKSFANGDGDLRKLLSHFEPELKVVIKNTYQDTEWNQNSMVRILEACHNQALDGDLRIENYFLPLYEANLESPCDPDFESEAYYEHENRLQVDDDYAEAECMREQRRSEERTENEMRSNRAWINFW
ncbi:hypothetical protein LTR95_007981, partial [Oleoguttula sp. CCFEE 5521]